MPDDEAVVDQMIREYGDAKSALRALVGAHRTLEREYELTHAGISYGFSRGWHHGRR
ncbi:hypothetical protein [Mesorhizobium sp. CAU 1732]|uniref:hypothetical protein n=1 Tax=Mesorhizobium sp. CAU 1732 TaxID=3140358 RepID=UPI003260D2A8